MVVLNRVVRHPEPRAVPARAQRLPEGAHEAPPAQRRHVVENAQRDQHHAAPGNGAAAAVRHPRAAGPRPSCSRPRAAAARGPELEAGLPGLAAAPGLLRPALACVSRTTFPLHEASPWWSCIRGTAYRTTVYVNSISIFDDTHDPSPCPEHRPFQLPATRPASDGEGRRSVLRLAARTRWIRKGRCSVVRSDDHAPRDRTVATRPPATACPPQPPPNDHDATEGLSTLCPSRRSFAT